jgi:hypothetical protein
VDDDKRCDQCLYSKIGSWWKDDIICTVVLPPWSDHDPSHEHKRHVDPWQSCIFWKQKENLEETE